MALYLVTLVAVVAVAAVAAVAVVAVVVAVVVAARLRQVLLEVISVIGTAAYILYVTTRQAVGAGKTKQVVSVPTLVFLKVEMAALLMVEIQRRFQHQYQR